MENVRRNYSNTKPNKLKQAGIGILGLIAGAYITGTTIETKRLSHELEPLRLELEDIAKTQNPKKVIMFDASDDRTRVVFDYGGAVDSINKTVKQFSKDNNAYFRNWGIVSENRIPASSAPLALNPKYWGQEINTSIYKK